MPGTVLRLASETVVHRGSSHRPAARSAARCHTVSEIITADTPIESSKVTQRHVHAIVVPALWRDSA